MKMKIEYTIEVDTDKAQIYLDQVGDDDSVREFVGSYCVAVAVDQIQQLFVNAIGEHKVVSLVKDHTR
tara:strand:+ start:703 stop:906 length:204 start_codon:yes stop_codon:yes gene_type:complete